MSVRQLLHALLLSLLDTVILCNSAMGKVLCMDVSDYVCLCFEMSV